MPPYTFQKKERLKSEKLIAQLFSRQQSVGEYPFRLFWMEVPEPQASPIQMAFSAPKKKFKRAVDRNRIRRLMREAYRLCKNKAYETLQNPEKPRFIVAMMLYVAPEELPAWDEWLRKMDKLLNKLLSSPTAKNDNK